MSDNDANEIEYIFMFFLKIFIIFYYFCTITIIILFFVHIIHVNVWKKNNKNLCYILKLYNFIYPFHSIIQHTHIDGNT